MSLALDRSRTARFQFRSVPEAALDFSRVIRPQLKPLPVFFNLGSLVRSFLCGA
jgi:hypothetical protein